MCVFFAKFPKETEKISLKTLDFQGDLAEGVRFEPTCQRANGFQGTITHRKMTDFAR